MCGIAGIIARPEAWCEPALRRMTEAQRHRGPDGEGMVVRQIGASHVHLGHRRLSIQDLSDAGAQPMIHPQSNDLLVFNGEIYNAPSLAATLRQQGISFRGHSDTEVLLHALRCWGIDCVSRLDGMFAFAWLDMPRKTLWLARDPLGIKPLYVHQKNGREFLFASELRALARSERLSSELDRRGVLGLLAFGSVQAPYTIRHDVSVFPAGHVQEISLDPTGWRLHAPRRYWRYPSPDQRVTTDEAVGFVREGLQSAVRKHLLSDVPVGVFLSAGFDSTIVASIAASEDADIRAYTVGFREDADFCESSEAAETAKRLRIPHQTLWLSQEDALSAVEPWLDSLDQPSMDGLNTYVISRHVRQAGPIVALSGQGGDELFGGYPSFTDVPRLLRLGRYTSLVPKGLIRSLAQGAGILWGEARREKLLDLLSAAPNPLALYLTRRRCLSDSQLASALEEPPNREAFLAECLDSGRLAELPLSAEDALHAVSILECHCYLGNTLLPVGDTNGMAHGLEIRVPFLDTPLVTRILSIPGAIRMPGRDGKKFLLRQAFPEHLRTTISRRPKQGFLLPMQRWMPGRLRDLCESALEVLTSHSFFHAAGIKRLWQAFLRDSESPLWSRVVILIALGHYLRSWPLR